MAEDVEVSKVFKDDKETIKFIETKMFDPAKRWKYLYAGDKHSNWIEDIKFYKNYQYGKKAKNRAAVSYNRIFSTIQKELPFMTDKPPRIFVIPEDPSDKVPAQLFERFMESAWRDRDMQLKIPAGVLNAKQIGTGFFRCFWNSDLANGLGDVDCEVLDPLEVFPFAYTKQLENCEGVVWARWVSLGYLRQNYSNGWEVKPEGDKTSDVPDRAKETNQASVGGYDQVSDMGAGSTYTASETHYLPSSSGTSYEGADFKKVLLKTVYFSDPSVQAGDEKEAKKILKKDEKTYPYGRCITYANGVILEDEPYPFKNFPGIIEILNYANPNEFWGMSDIHQIKDGQKALNRISSDILTAVKRGIFTTKFIQKQSGIDADDFVVTDDACYETNVPNPVTELTPQALQAQVMTYPQEIERAIAATAGTADYNAPNSGQLPSGRSLLEFQEITQTRLRQKLRNLSSCIRLIANMWLEMMLNNYTEQRIMRIVNPHNGDQEYVYVYKEVNPDVAKSIKEQVMKQVIPGTEEMDPQSGQPLPNTGTPKYKHILNLADLQGGFDISVADNSTVSTSKVASFDQSMMLFQAGIIDAEAVLDAADYPEKEEISRRMEKQKQQAMQAQQQQMQMQLQMKEKDDNIKVGTEVNKSKTTMSKAEIDNMTKIRVAEMNRFGKSMDSKEEKVAKIERDM
jgi:hypothetical protein